MSAQDLAASEAHQTLKATPDDVNRRSAGFSPSIWGDHFVSYASKETDTIAEDEGRIQELKEKVKRMLMATTSQKLDLIDDLQRLGLSRHVENEIDQVLQKLHKDSISHGSDGEDLHVAALKFRLLRQQGYQVSCDMFNKFKDNDGKFKESLFDDANVAGLLSLFEAAHLKIHGEEILDEALTFSTTHLKSAMRRLGPPLLEKVTGSLYQPFWKGYPRVEAWHYLSIYEHDDLHDENLLTLAKLDFNQVQQVHQRELSEVSSWWKELDFVSKLPFVRDRIVESYFWALAINFEPEYHFSRTTLCKVIALITTVDDIYDVYGTYEQLKLFTDAIERWDITSMDQLPKYMKVCYKALLDLYTGIEDELEKDGNLYRIDYAKESMKIHIRAYWEEAKWLHQKYTPTTDEYMSVSLMNSYFMPAILSFVRMGDVVTKDFLDWIFKNPKILKAVALLGRLLGDIKTRKFEQKREHIPSLVECYMKENGVTEEETIIELEKQENNAWMDINQEWINLTTIARPLLLRILNFARGNEQIYKGEDGFTHGIVLKDIIVSLFVKPLPI